MQKTLTQISTPCEKAFSVETLLDLGHEEHECVVFPYMCHEISVYNYLQCLTIYIS